MVLKIVAQRKSLTILSRITHNLRMAIRQIRNLGNSGQSLIGVLVGVAIASLVSLLLMQILQSSVQGQALIRAKQSAINVQMETIGILSTRSICELNFKNVSTSATASDTLTQLSSAPGVVFIQENRPTIKMRFACAISRFAI